jgi:hypothetical protein
LALIDSDKICTIQAVEEEVLLLASFAGKDQARPLNGVDWDSDYTFSNGCRSPPWRQIYGELGYLTVRTRDKDTLNITASKKGLFINKGYTANTTGTYFEFLYFYCRRGNVEL